MTRTQHKSVHSSMLLEVYRSTRNRAGITALLFGVTNIILGATVESLTVYPQLTDTAVTTAPALTTVYMITAVIAAPTAALSVIYANYAWWEKRRLNHHQNPIPTEKTSPFDANRNT